MAQPEKPAGKFRPARPGELTQLLALFDDVGDFRLLIRPRGAGHGPLAGALLRRCLRDRCLLVCADRSGIEAASALDLERGAIGALVIARQRGREAELLSGLVRATERLAASFGLRLLRAQPKDVMLARFTELGYRETQARRRAGRQGGGRVLQRSLADRETRLARQARQAAERLGIPAGYGSRHRMPLQPEARRLVEVGENPFGRAQQLAPRSAAAWSRLRSAAAADGICLQLVSGFRSLRYQEEILRRKLARGIAIENVLRVSAAPGYSEHHSGRALDLTTPGYPALEPEFELSPAFRWLSSHAAALGFRLSFGRRNRHRLAYEPWHWYYAGNSVNRGG